MKNSFNDRGRGSVGAKRLALLITDAASVVAASFLALLVRFEFSISGIYGGFIATVMRTLPFSIFITIAVFFIFKMYQSLLEFVGETELQNIVAASVIAGIANSAVLQFFKVSNPAVPRSFYFLYTVFLIMFAFISRFSYRFIRSVFNKKESPVDLSVMVIGAGDAGNTIIRELVNSASGMKLSCIIDDDRNKWGSYIQGILVVGGRDKIEECADLYDVDEIIIAIPSLKGKELSELLNICKETNCRLRVLPSVHQLVNGEADVSKLREVDVEDLLGREPVEIDTASIAEYVSGRVVMVTGGGGSIGSELCRQIAGHNPGQLIILDIYENNVYDLQQELEKEYPGLGLEVLIASVRDYVRIKNIFERYRPEIVYHAAAHKHVPLMENSPAEAVKNNIFGTYNCAKSAAETNTKRFVMISTDKAVNPTNIMGATKRVCEMIIQTLNRESKTEFVAVRFGNVLGSNGSVIPLFKKQIETGGPVTVTDPEIIRYFMTIPEAVSLVLQAGAYAKGGEIFILDMGEPVRILDLAENLIKLSGYRVGIDIPIVFTGLRPGEKLYEEMLMKEEGMQDTANKLIHVGRPIEFNEEEFFTELEKLKNIKEDDPLTIKKEMMNIVKTYNPNAV